MLKCHQFSGNLQTMQSPLIHHYPRLITLQILHNQFCGMIPMCTRNLQKLAVFSSYLRWGMTQFCVYHPFDIDHVFPFHPFFRSKTQCFDIHGWPRDESLHPYTLGAGRLWESNFVDTSPNSKMELNEKLLCCGDLVTRLQWGCFNQTQFEISESLKPIQKGGWIPKSLIFAHSISLIIIPPNWREAAC